MKEQNIKIISNTEGETLGIAGGNYRIVISGEETKGAYAVIEMNVPPGGGPPPHAHPGFQELFYVVTGEFEFKTEAGTQMVNEGGFVNIPFNGAIHCFKNQSATNGKLLCTVIPSGLENYFKEAVQSAPAGPPQPPSPERLEFMKKLDEKYGQRIYPRDYFETK